jgi:peptidoglycan/LPS O-acetylase OafA/YrhL
MMNRATAAFVFSIIGAAYQMISLYVAVLIDRNTSPFFYFTVGYYTLFLTGFIVIWSASHILEDWKGRITWPSIILVLGIANLASVVMSDYAQTSPIQGSATVPSLTVITAIVSGPLLIVIGGILGFSAVRQYSREHGHAVLGHA